jgi:hypothetical protein
MIEGSGLDSREYNEFFFFGGMLKLGLGPTRPSVKFVPRFYSRTRRSERKAPSIEMKTVKLLQAARVFVTRCLEIYTFKAEWKFVGHVL